MIIKKYKPNNNFHFNNIFKDSPIKINITKKVLIILIVWLSTIIIASSYWFWFGAFKHIDGTLGRYRVFINSIIAENVKIPSNFIKGLFSEPQKLSFDIKFKDLQFIEYQLSILRQNKKPPDSIFTKYIPAILTHNSQKYKAKIRIILTHQEIIALNRTTALLKDF